MRYTGPLVTGSTKSTMVTKTPDDTKEALLQNFEGLFSPNRKIFRRRRSRVGSEEHARTSSCMTFRTAKPHEVPKCITLTQVQYSSHQRLSQSLVMWLSHSACLCDFEGYTKPYTSRGITVCSPHHRYLVCTPESACVTYSDCSLPLIEHVVCPLHE